MTQTTPLMEREASSNARALQSEPMRWQRTSPVIAFPEEMLNRYIDVALRPATPKQTAEGEWYCALDNFPGVWAEGDSLKACLDTLSEVLKEWLVIKIVSRDVDIPIVDEIDLTAISQRC
jgi:predicted RNase H-like HicB family nuclease